MSDCELRVGDCVDVMAAMGEASVDAVVCDPPYGIRFMGAAWDGEDIDRHARRQAEIDGPAPGPISRGGGQRTRSAYGNPAAKAGLYDFSLTGTHAFQAWCHAWAEQAFRVLKPGGHLLAMGGSRTWHRLASAIEDAGFEIRDCITYLYGSGFPKSLNVSERLRQTIPGHEQCACARRSTRTAEDSQDGYPSNPHSGDGQPRPVPNDAPTAPPSQGGALARTHAGRCLDGQGEEPASTDPGGETARLSSEGSARPVLSPSTTSLAADSTPFGTSSSTSLGDLTANHRTARHTPRTSDSASDSPLRNWNLPRCPDCSGYIIQPGLGTALKPAVEFIVVARKPLAGTVAGNCLEFGTGALNVDGCRIEGPSPTGYPNGPGGKSHHYSSDKRSAEVRPDPWEPAAAGRWPANVVLDEEAAAMLDQQTGELHATGNKGGTPKRWQAHHLYSYEGEDAMPPGYPDSGGASRFFYVAKASRAERNAGLDGFEEQRSSKLGAGLVSSIGASAEAHGLSPGSTSSEGRTARNHHPTVKPVALMRWLVRLVTPPDGLVLDPFAGSGTTGIAAHLEGFRFLGIERDADYAAIAEARIAWWVEHGEDALRIVAERERAELARAEITAAGQLELLAEGTA